MSLGGGSTAGRLAYSQTTYKVNVGHGLKENVYKLTIWNCRSWKNLWKPSVAADKGDGWSAATSRDCPRGEARGRLSGQPCAHFGLRPEDSMWALYSTVTMTYFCPEQRSKGFFSFPSGITILRLLIIGYWLGTSAYVRATNILPFWAQVREVALGMWLH